MDKLTAMRVFAAVVDEGGFSAAARRLHMSKSAVSTWVRDLEAELGTGLLNRTTRSVTLTEAGRRYKARIDQILADIAEAEAEAGSDTLEPRGVLRVTVGTSFATRALAPLIGPFMARHPKVEVDLNLSDRFVDLVEEGFDLAIRIGYLPDSSLTARKLGETRRVVAAAPSYLERHGRPERPEDLRNHNCLIYSLTNGGGWGFQRDGKAFTVHVTGNLAVNNGEILRQAAIDGLGICLAPTFIIHDCLAQGTLVPLLTEYELPALGIHAVFPSHRHLSAKVRSFIDFVAAELRAIDANCSG